MRHWAKTIGAGSFIHQSDSLSSERLMKLDFLIYCLIWFLVRNWTLIPGRQGERPTDILSLNKARLHLSTCQHQGPRTGKAPPSHFTFWLWPSENSQLLRNWYLLLPSRCLLALTHPGPPSTLQNALMNSYCHCLLISPSFY